MKRINNIFYSLQGEGRNTGRAAVFVRFAGCNLRCPFCDTEFDSYREMTDEEIVETLQHLTPNTQHLTDRILVVLTGGEPTLQVDEAFVDLLHRHGYEVAMESNGTRLAPKNLDWLTVSPKVIRGEGQEVRGERLPDELKIMFDENTAPETYLSPLTSHLSPPSLCSPIAPSSRLPLKPYLYLQPCDTGDAERNARILKRCVEYIKEHPQWRLSLQTHKLIGIE